MAYTATSQAKAEADQKRIEAQRAHNQIKLCYYFKNGEPPEHLRVQGITTLPNFNLSLFPRVLSKMKLAADAEVYFYDFPSGIWTRDDIDTTLTVVPNQTLLVRQLDVTVCKDIDAMIQLYAPVSKSGKAASFKRKPDHERDSSNRVVQVARTTQSEVRRPRLPPIDVDSFPTALPSPAGSPSSLPSASALLSFAASRSSSSSSVIDLTSSPSSDHWSPSPDIFAKPELLHDSSLSDVTNTLSTADELWEQGHVLVQHGLGTWPQGIYARDMAFAFKRITGRGNDEVEDRFKKVFPGVEYKKATFYCQLGFWKDSTQQERDAATNMPRNGDGWWTTWRGTSSGQQKFNARKSKA
ncbi:hypothetical protein C8J57DRAFT_1480094 [Mycena rebaudengoi]|nr:hypothetical protein C8J57DRAFT_1480094 [Mycena rebaudengoi]